MTAEVWSEEAANYAIIYGLMTSGTAYRDLRAYALIRKLSNNLKGEIPVSADIFVRDGAVYEVLESTPISSQDVHDRIQKANEHLAGLHDLANKVAAAEQQVQGQVSSDAASDGSTDQPVAAQGTDPNAVAEQPAVATDQAIGTQPTDPSTLNPQPSADQPQAALPADPSQVAPAAPAQPAATSDPSVQTQPAPADPSQAAPAVGTDNNVPPSPAVNA